VHLSNFFHDRERMAAVLRSACTMLNSPTEFESRGAALAYLRGSRGERETEASLNHRLDHNMHRINGGYKVKYDSVRVAQGLAHMARDLRAYAARVECPVLVVRSTIDSELSAQDAVGIAGLWRNGRAVDVEGGYLLYLQNPRGVAEAITTFVESLDTVGAKA
jgi:pimeloyl-ACP methyl ester carboxylesterase